MTRIPDFAHHCKEVMLFIGIKMIHIASVRVEGLGNAILLKPFPLTPVSGYDCFFAGQACSPCFRNSLVVQI